MYLKKLELSGFKSFAKTTVLEFPARVTAIVGPNGSGKSNIAESIRWVLGEQSMKSLRGKKGEDLIWNGSPSGVGAQIPRMGKASVTMIFDNEDHRIPLDFDEVVIGRKIFRDGLNEYYLNNSQVRLKDVVEILARIGLGEQKHNIIGQGEVDRIIMASARERREMLEEALGLRIYQLRKNETERKLEQTANNMRQVEALLREIAPHLKFLKTQAQKAEARESLEAELKLLQKTYFFQEAKEIEQEKNKIIVAANPFRQKKKELSKEIVGLWQEIAKAEKEISGDKSEKSEEEKKLVELEARGRELEREIGRLEGRLEVEQEKAAQPKVKVVDAKYIQAEIKELTAGIREILNEDRSVIIKSNLEKLLANLEHLADEISRGTVEEKKDPQESAIVKELSKTLKNLQEELGSATAQMANLEAVEKQYQEKYRAAQQSIRELDATLRAKQDEDKEIALALERFKFDEERLEARAEIWAREVKEAGISEKDLASQELENFSMAGEELKRKIERLRARLEEIGGIDTSVVKEYQETETRHSFLAKELEDLKQASISLKELVKELDKHVKEDFKNGFAKIKEEFHNYFRIIFGGGRAALQLVDVPVRGGQEEDDNLEEKSRLTEPGIEISLDLPQKRIKGLAMLSGGERALTSIALLFSITAVNPPPFLILDETDAALDEANSQRYAAILKELAQRTQLILVTHNRETMKSASILYGVTMGNEGVSKLLSLKLEEAEAFTNR